MAFDKNTAFGILACIGGILIHLTYGHFYTIGNLAPYMMSYIKVRVDPNVDMGSAVWISAIALAIQGVSMPLGGAALPKIGYRAVIIIGSLINSGSVLLTYYTIQKGFIYVVLTYAVTLGFGFGFSYAVIFSVAASWFPERRGLIVGFIVGGFGIGALVFTPLQTAYINPNNTNINNITKVFDDPELLDRVPKAFLLLGGSLAALQIIGMILLRQKESTPPNSSPDVDTQGKSEAKDGDDETNQLKTAAGDIETAEPAGEEAATQPFRRTRGLSTHSLHAAHTDLAPATHEQEVNARRSISLPKELNYTPLQALRRHEFYILWFIMLCNIIPITLITASFKLVALSSIPDDRFLSAVATASSIFNSGGRIIWGAICDKFSFKLPLCVMLGAWAMILFTFPHVATIQGPTVRYFYPIWVCLLFLFLSGVFTLMPAATGRIFGPVNMAVNYGMVFSAFSVGSVICAVISARLDGLYIILYSFCGSCCILALLLASFIHDPYIPRMADICKSLSSICQRIQPRVPPK